MSVSGRPSELDRWAGFTHRETMDMHHALRMFAKYPGLPPAEAEDYTRLADEIWNRHTKLVEAKRGLREWAIGYRNGDGEVRITPRFYSSLEEAQEWFDYLCGPWREELEEKAAKEEKDEKRSVARGKGMTANWARMTLKDKKKEQHILLTREVTPYSILAEAPEWS